MLTENAVVDVVGAEYLHDYVIKLSFSDGAEQTVDFGGFLAHSTHPEINKYLDKSRFLAFKIEHGDLLWGDYELCFPVADLYDNHIAA